MKCQCSLYPFAERIGDRPRFPCQRYIELNPVRAAIVNRPGEYRWSSYRANAQGEKDVLLSHHPLYVRLGQTREERQGHIVNYFDKSWIPE